MLCYQRIRNEKITVTTKVGETSMKGQERRVKKYGNVIRRDEECLGGKEDEDGCGGEE